MTRKAISFCVSATLAAAGTMSLLGWYGDSVDGKPVKHLGIYSHNNASVSSDAARSANNTSENEYLTGTSGTGAGAAGAAGTAGTTGAAGGVGGNANPGNANN